FFFFFFSSRRRHTRWPRDWSSDVCSSDLVPRDRFWLEALRTVNLAGSPASPECMGWFYRNVKEDLWVANGSGGTDCCTGFVGGVPTLPVRAGEIQAPSLGVSVKAYNARGESVVDEGGELVIT